MTRRVALFVATLEGGGAERAMVELANGLNEAGLPVDLVVIRDSGPWRQLLSDKVRLTVLRSRYFATRLAKLVGYLWQTRPIVLIATDTAPIVLALLTKAAAPRHAVVARLSSNLTASFADVNFKWRLIGRLQAGLLPWADAVVANSEGSAADARKGVPRVASRVCTIHNPVVSHHLADQARMPVDHPWFGAGEPPVTLSVGRLVAEKDHATLLRAFALLAARRPGRLIVLGEGEQRPHLTRLAQNLGIADQVDFPGFQNNPFAFMARARLFALSSAYEGMPNVLIQAMACGTPVVSTDCPSGPREVLEDGKWGALVPVGDPVALATAMETTLDNPIQGSLLARRAGEFSAEASVRGYLDLIESLSRA